MEDAAPAPDAEPSVSISSRESLKKFFCIFDQNRKLETEIKKVHKEREECRQENSNCQVVLEKLEAKLAKKTEIAQALGKDVQRLIDELREQRERKEKEFEALKMDRNNKEMKLRIRELKKLIQDHSIARIQRVKSQDNAYQTYIDEAKAECEDLRLDNHRLRGQNHELGQQILTLQGNIFAIEKAT